MTAPVVVTDSDDETAVVVMVSGLVPKTAVAPEGSPIALSVSVQALLFPLCEIDTVPKTAVSPGATDTLVGDATVTVPGCAAMTVPIPASIPTRRTEASVVTSRRGTSGEGLRDDIRNQTSMGTITRNRAEATMARRRCVQGPPDVSTSAERKGYAQDSDANRRA